MTVSDDAASADPAPSLRDRIVGAAFSLFMERGYGGTSTLDIARRARVSKRDIYAAFGSKQAMLVACISERSDRMNQPLKLPVPTSPAALLATLTAYGCTLLLEVSRPEVLMTHRLAVAESDRAPELARTLDELGRGRNLAELTGLLAAARKSRLLADGEPEDIADVFLSVLWRRGLMVRLLLRVADAPDEAERQQRALFAADTVLRLFATPREPAPA